MHAQLSHQSSTINTSATPVLLLVLCLQDAAQVADLT